MKMKNLESKKVYIGISYEFQCYVIYSTSGNEVNALKSVLRSCFRTKNPAVYNNFVIYELDYDFSNTYEALKQVFDRFKGLIWCCCLNSQKNIIGQINKIFWEENRGRNFQCQ